MQRLTDNKIVLVTRPTRLGDLVARFNTTAQARFYVEHLGADFSDYLNEDQTYQGAVAEAQSTLAKLGRVQVVDRRFLPNFVFGPEDTIVTVGQDGLVANTLKYLDGQPVVAVNPDPQRWDGRLLPFRVTDLAKVIPEVFARGRTTRSITMARASLNNGQTLYAVNDLFIGPKSHVSARYFIRCGDLSESQSSSGVVVSTGLGSTGWFKSLLTGATAVAQAAAPVLANESRHRLSNKPSQFRSSHPGLRTEFAWDASYLFFTVREPFPTQTTGASIVFGRVSPEVPLVIESQMAEHGVIFSDGIEQDFLEFNSGSRAVIDVADRKGVLVV